MADKPTRFHYSTSTYSAHHRTRDIRKHVRDRIDVVCVWLYVTLNTRSCVPLQRLRRNILGRTTSGRTEIFEGTRNANFRNYRPFRCVPYASAAPIIRNTDRGERVEFFRVESLNRGRFHRTIVSIRPCFVQPSTLDRCKRRVSAGTTRVLTLTHWRSVTVHVSPAPIVWVETTLDLVVRGKP